MAEGRVRAAGIETEALFPGVEAVTLRRAEAATDVYDGPYADTEEQLGGFYLIDVPDLETALEWAARNPAASTGAVEVRRVAAERAARRPAEPGSERPVTGRGPPPDAPRVPDRESDAAIAV